MSTTAEQTTSIPTGTWSLDPVHSSVGFAVQLQRRRHLPRHVRRVRRQARRRQPRGRRQGRERPASTTPNLAGHLQSPDFFDAEQYPELRFVSKSIERDGDDVSIEGDLTLRGVTQPVEIAGTVVGPTLSRRFRAEPADRASTSRRRSTATSTGIDVEHGAPGRRPGARRRRRRSPPTSRWFRRKR